MALILCKFSEKYTLQLRDRCSQMHNECQTVNRVTMENFTMENFRGQWARKCNKCSESKIPTEDLVPEKAFSCFGIPGGQLNSHKEKKTLQCQNEDIAGKYFAIFNGIVAQIIRANSHGANGINTSSIESQKMI